MYALPHAPVLQRNNTGRNHRAREETEAVVTGLRLVEDGISEYVIVRGENAFPSEVTASTELQSYLKQISGAELPIVTDAAAPGEKEIIVGKTNRETEGEFNREELGEDGFIIKTVENKLYLVGGEKRGTLYSVYEFLESYLGCGFYTQDVEVVPEMTTVILEPIAEDKQIPVVLWREMGWEDYGNVPTFCAKRKVFDNGGKYVEDEWGGERGWAGGTDNVSRLVSPAEYYDTHPEYFALVNGERMKENVGGGPQLCLSNPEVLEVLTEKVREQLKNGKDKLGMYAVAQMDNQSCCMCDNCMKIYEEEGGAFSSTMLRAVNYVATALKEEFPEMMFLTLAYNYTSSAPTVTKPVDNVAIMKTVHKCMSHDVNAECSKIYTGATSNIDGTANSFVEDLTAWGKICDKM